MGNGIGHDFTLLGDRTAKVRCKNDILHGSKCFRQNGVRLSFKNVQCRTCDLFCL